MSDDDLRRSARLALEARMRAANGEDAADRDEQRSGRRNGRRSSVTESIERRSNSARKRKADRMFDRQIGEDDAPSEAGPRPAVYRGKMGRSHKRSARIQNERAGTATSLRGRIAERIYSGARPAFFTPVALVACLALVCAFLYAPAKGYYTSVRDEAKAEAQLAVLQQQNEELQQRADQLSSDSGVADEARSDYGWVKDGENAVRVSGLSSSSSDQQQDPSAASGTSVTAPDTWYSGVLDQVFGYQKE